MGTVLTVLSSVISILYLFKPVQVTVSSVFLILIAFVWGQAWAHLTPSPARLSGTRFAFLQGPFRFLNFGQPFGIKEHTVAVLLASCSNNSASGIETIAIEKLFYNRSPDALTTVMGLFAVSLCGFVLAGVFRTTTIYPSDCVYWSTLPMVSLLQALHFDLSGASENKKRVTFFGKALVVSSLYTLRELSEDIENLRERVAEPDLIGSQVPVVVHIESIKAGLGRLQEGRIKSKERGDYVGKRIMSEA